MPANDMVFVNDLPHLPPREPTAHKGNFGRVLVVGGSVGMVGAPALAANAALRSGAGLVTIAVPMLIQQAAAILCPCATSFPLPQSQTGTLAASAIPVLRNLAQNMDVLAVGPGLGRHLDLAELVKWTLDQGQKPVVLDADGLNTLAEQQEWWPVLPPMVFTPHPGEMQRLLACAKLNLPLNDKDETRQQAAFELARLTNAVMVLKGYRTVVTDGRRVFINTTGNPGMATGGMGDILTGIISALIGQGLPQFEAAMLGVYVHGLAGDMAALKLGQVSLMACDMLNYLPQAWQRV